MRGGILRQLADNSRRAIGEGTYNIQESVPGGRDFVGALRGRTVPIISEVKFASPSRGIIHDMIEPETVAGAMVAGGAAALSVLTQPYMFGGSPEYLMRVRREVPVPVLMKDIIVDHAQVHAAHRMGADCILLIQAVFDAGYATNMDQFIDAAHQYGIQVLLEVHSRAELDRALFTGCDIIGVNNRNLDTLEISLDTTCEVLTGYGDARIIISESGISTPHDIRRLWECGARAFLVGSSIMAKDNIKGSVDELVNAL